MASVILQGSPAELAVGGGGTAGVTSIAEGQYISVDSTNPDAPVVSWKLGVGTGLAVTGGAVQLLGTDFADGAARFAQASIEGSIILNAPNQVIATLDNANFPGLIPMFANDKYNVIELFAQFGIETTGDVPRVIVGFNVVPNVGTAYQCGDVALGQQKLTAPATSDAPPSGAYVLRASLVRGVHYGDTTTSLQLVTSATSTVSGAEITQIQDDSNPATPNQPIVFTATMFV